MKVHNAKQLIAGSPLHAEELPAPPEAAGKEKNGFNLIAVVNA
jgi:hypothetical protein